MRFLLLTIITLSPTYLIRFHVGGIPTTFLEILILFTFSFWSWRKLVASRGRYGWSREDERRGTPAESGAISHLQTKRRDGERVAARRSEDERDLPCPPAPKRAFVVPIILFLLAGVTSIIIAPDHRAALGLFKAYIVEPILFFIMFTDTARDWSPRANLASGGTTVWRDVTIALSLSALGVALPAIVQEWNPIGIPNIHWAAEATRRVTSWYGFPNAIGLYLAPLIPFFVVQLFKKQKMWVTGYWVLVTVVAITAIIFARSEGALAALLVVGIISGLLYTPTRLSVTVIGLLFAIATVTNTPWREYVYEQVTLHNDSGKVRVQQWKETVAMLRDTTPPLGVGRIIFGAGLSGYPVTVAPYHKQQYIEIYQYPHTIVLNFWSEMGLMGTLAFFWIILLFLYRSTRAKQYALLASMAIILIHGLVDVPYFKNDLAIFFWMLVALTLRTTPSIVEDNYSY